MSCLRREPPSFERGRHFLGFKRYVIHQRFLCVILTDRGVIDNHLGFTLLLTIKRG